MSATDFQRTTAPAQDATDVQTETASVLHFAMCDKLRKQFSDWRKQRDQQAADTAKAKREGELLRGYAERHKPETPDAA